jgi:hypothetical protein
LDLTERDTTPYQELQKQIDDMYRRNGFFQNLMLGNMNVEIPWKVDNNQGAYNTNNSDLDEEIYTRLHHYVLEMEARKSLLDEKMQVLYPYDDRKGHGLLQLAKKCIKAIEKSKKGLLGNNDEQMGVAGTLKFYEEMKDFDSIPFSGSSEQIDSIKSNIDAFIKNEGIWEKRILRYFQNSLN